MIEGWARQGLTDEQIAKNMGIGLTTLKQWKKKYRPIWTALKKGKTPVDFEVENALLKRAMGFEYEETETIIEEVDGKQRKRIKKIKKVALPETSAIIFWLKNRMPEQWRKFNPVVEAKIKAETQALLKDTEVAPSEEIVIVDRWDDD